MLDLGDRQIRIGTDVRNLKLGEAGDVCRTDEVFGFVRNVTRRCQCLVLKFRRYRRNSLGTKLDRIDNERVFDAGNTGVAHAVYETQLR